MPKEAVRIRSIESGSDTSNAPPPRPRRSWHRRGAARCGRLPWGRAVAQPDLDEQKLTLPPRSPLLMSPEKQNLRKSTTDSTMTSLTRPVQVCYLADSRTTWQAKEWTGWLWRTKNGSHNNAKCLARTIMQKRGLLRSFGSCPVLWQTPGGSGVLLHKALCFRFCVHSCVFVRVCIAFQKLKQDQPGLLTLSQELLQVALALSCEDCTQHENASSATRFWGWFSACQRAFMCIFLHARHAAEFGWGGGGGFGWGLLLYFVLFGHGLVAT